MDEEQLKQWLKDNLILVVDRPWNRETKVGLRFAGDPEDKLFTYIWIREDR